MNKTTIPALIAFTLMGFVTFMLTLALYKAINPPIDNNNTNIATNNITFTAGETVFISGINQTGLVVFSICPRDEQAKIILPHQTTYVPISAVYKIKTNAEK